MEEYGGPHNDSARHGQISSAAASRYARPEVAQPPPPLPHAPRPSIPTSTRTSPQFTREIITLDMVRGGPRPQNEYVDSPHLTVVKHKTNNNNIVGENRDVSLYNHRTPGRGVSTTTTSTITTAPVFVQPAPTGLKKDFSALEEPEHNDSIICSQCGECKCDSCTQPRELPSRWICNGKCHCSATTIVEYCTCLCCVKAVFYHCCKDYEQDLDVVSADAPCACCSRPHCCKRWTCMALMSLCLPCLCCYWPLRCGVKMCTACYNRCSGRGCRCRKDLKKPVHQSSKRLLIESESSSA